MVHTAFNVLLVSYCYYEANRILIYKYLYKEYWSVVFCFYDALV